MGMILMPGGGGGIDLDVVTAAAGDILSGKVIVGVDGEPLTGTLALTGNAGTGDVLAGKTFYNADAKTKLAGTMPNRGALNWSGINTTKAVDAGYYSDGTLDSRPSYTAGQNAVKNSPNSYGLYTKAQYDANYNNGYNVASSNLKAKGMSGMEWKGSAGTKENTYNIPAGTKQVIVICSAGYGNGGGTQSSQQNAWCDIKLNPAATSGEAIINNNTDKSGTYYAYATIAYKYNLNGSATTVTVQHNTSGSMLYFSSMVVYI